MEVKNCKSCGRLFNYIGATTPLCPQCMKKLDDKYEAVKQYIYDNPRANINQVSEDMEVSVPQIQRWIREERLSFSEDSAIGLECEKCGTMIRTGRFCATCKGKMRMEFGSVIPRQQIQTNKTPKDASAKMRFLDQ